MPREDPAGKIVFAIVLLLFFLVCFIALMTFLAAVFRDTSERSKNALVRSLWRTCLIGLAGYMLLGGLAAWLYSQAIIVRLLETEVVPGLLVPAVVLSALPLVMSLLGAPGMFGYVGDRLAELHGGEMNGLKRTAMGALVAVFAALFPLVGWFVITPVLLVASFGAGAGGIFRLG